VRLIDSGSFYECNKESICKLKGLYFLDWTARNTRWRKSVPLSWIYSSDPGNLTLLQSLQGLNESIKTNRSGQRTVLFSGPSHMQEYRKGMSFVKLSYRCEHHSSELSWSGKTPSQLIAIKKYEATFSKKFTKAQIDSKDKYIQLWQTHTVIYPNGFDLSIQHRIDPFFNHIELEDKTTAKIKRVILYS
jgi:hypothetical protein